MHKMTSINSAGIPSLQIPDAIVDEYAVKLEALYGLPQFLFESPEAVVQCGLLLELWQGLVGFKAHFHPPWSSMVQPGTPRAALIEAMQCGSSEDVLVAFEACKADGLPEIQERMDGLRRFCGLLN
jgi:hypothetical protein